MQVDLVTALKAGDVDAVSVLQTTLVTLEEGGAAAAGIGLGRLPRLVEDGTLWPRA